MSEPFIIDAHAHTGAMNLFFCPESSARQLLARMDRQGIRQCVNAGGWTYMLMGGRKGLEELRRQHLESQGRIFYLGVYDPRRGREALAELKEALGWPGFTGIKIHPSFHRTPAEDPAYELVWSFAAEHDLTVMGHSWTVSDYNPVQALSLPRRFEGWLRRYPGVRFVLAHAGGRGNGRADAARMARELPNVYQIASTSAWTPARWQKQRICSRPVMLA